MFENKPEVMRKAGDLKLKVGDLVRINPHAMLNGGGLAVITKVHTEELKGMHEIIYLKNGHETMADDMIDILEIVSRGAK